MIQSMSRRANPCDIAWTESFMGTLKREMLQDGCFDCPEDVQSELFGYIDGYYNSQRKHSAQGYLSPSQFEVQLLVAKYDTTGPEIDCTAKDTTGKVVQEGTYRTKDTILEIYDKMHQAITTGHPYQTRLEPPPADPRCCHPPLEVEA
jgi:hypothetical protein